jgi:acyl carrier protein
MKMNSCTNARSCTKELSIHSSLTAEVILERLRARLPNLELKPDQRLSSHSIDSVDLVELLCTIDAEFGVRISETDLAADPTLIKLAASIAAQAKNCSSAP